MGDIVKFKTLASKDGRIKQSGHCERRVTAQHLPITDSHCD
jgi:hypothetical protein